MSGRVLGDVVELSDARCDKVILPRRESYAGGSACMSLGGGDRWPRLCMVDVRMGEMRPSGRRTTMMRTRERSAL